MYNSSMEILKKKNLVRKIQRNRDLIFRVNRRITLISILNILNRDRKCTDCNQES